MEKGVVTESSVLVQGTLLNNQYIVVDVLSRDCLEIRYLAEDYLTHRRVVICELFPRAYMTRLYGSETPVFYSHEAEEIFQQLKIDYQIETTRLSQLQDSGNIEKVEQYFEEQGMIYRIVEYCPGQSLDEYFEKNGKLPPDEAKQIAEGIADGLRQLHQAGILHGNISPETVWITQDRQIKLEGLGSVRMIYSAHAKQMGDLFSPGYVAYERYGDANAQGAWTDLYSFGAIMYRMLTGYVPPDSMERSLDDTLLPPTELGVDLSGEEESRLMKCLNLSAADRYQSIEEWMMDGEEKQYLVEAEKKQKKRNWKRIFLCIGILFLLVGAGYIGARIGIHKLKNSERTRSPAQQENDLKNAKELDEGLDFKIRKKEKTLKVSPISDSDTK